MIVKELLDELKELDEDSSIYISADKNGVLYLCIASKFGNYNIYLPAHQ